MDTIEQLIADIMADEQNATYTQQGIKPLFTVPKRLGLILSDKLLAFVRKSRVCIGMIQVVIICENGWAWTEKYFTILGFLRLYQWIIIFRERENQVICRHERALLKSGTNEPWLLLQILNYIFWLASMHSVIICSRNLLSR